MACVAGFTAPLNSATAQSGECLQSPSLDSHPDALPPDVCHTGPIVSDNDFYALSWQLFKFLVWPASGDRGKPDTSKKITSMEGPRVFETFKADWETFLPDAKEPGAWDNYPESPCSNQPVVGDGVLVLASSSKFGNLSVGGKRAHLLVAQNRTYVRYQAGFNKPLFEKIKNENLYDASVAERLEAARPTTDISLKASAPFGAMTVKSAWIELPGEGNIDPSKFYVRHDAWVQIPGTKQCRKSDVGLVGLHIVYKTKALPHWIWATFEHVDNVPEQGDDPNKRYTFHNGDLNAHMTTGPEDEYLISDQPGAAVPAERPRAYQVERLQKIDPNVVAMNGTWQAALSAERPDGSVWKNYKLIMSQWQGVRFVSSEDVSIHEPKPICTTDTAPASANTTMETFQQSCVLHQTCMGCHNETRNTDFIWAIKLNPYRPTAFRDGQSRTEAIKKLEDILGRKR
jgi:hypothetical protein